MLAKYRVDERGNTSGFSATGEAGPFGKNLQVGQEVELQDGIAGKIKEVYSYIQTDGPHPNYVAVAIGPAP